MKELLNPAVVWLGIGLIMLFALGMGILISQCTTDEPVEVEDSADTGLSAEAEQQLLQEIGYLK